MNFNLKKTLKKSLRRITKSDFVINLISSAIYWYARLVGKTTSWEVRGIDNFYREWDDNRGIILVAWHGRPLCCLISGTEKNRLMPWFHCTGMAE